MTPLASPIDRTAELWRDIESNRQALAYLEAQLKTIQSELLRHQNVLFVSDRERPSVQSQLERLTEAVERLADSQASMRADMAESSQRRLTRIWALLVPLLVLLSGAISYNIWQAILMAQRLPKLP